MSVEARLVKLTKRETRGIDFDFSVETVQDGVQIKKFDHEEQAVFGEVYAPDFPDSQGDVMSREEVKKARHNWMRKGLTSPSGMAKRCTRSRR